MNYKNDDLLNKYIDNDFSSVELDQINSALESNPDLVKELKAFKIVDQSLKTIEIETAPEEITEKIMNLVFAAVKQVKPKARVFFISISSFFALTIIITFSFVLSMTLNSAKQINSEPAFNKVKEGLNTILGNVNHFFSNGTVMMIGAFISLLLLTFLYYSFESHKHFKNKINNALKS